MKNIIKIFLLSFLVFTVGCESDDDPRFQDSPETGWVQFNSASTTVAVNSRVSSVSVLVTFTAPINLNDLDVGFNIVNVDGVATDVVVSPGTSLTILKNTNSALINFELLPDAVATLVNGDINFDVVLTSASRGISVGLADGSATTSHRISLLCGGEPQIGTFTIDMHDTFGDGWQTDDGNGGSGMTVLITDVTGAETEVEFGMCSPYTSAAGTFLGGSGCTTGTYDATATVDVPAGSTNAVWNFPGDWWGEISFEIYNPDGTLLYASGGAGDQGSGEIPVSYCQ